MKKVIIILFMFQSLSFAQNKKGQNEISLPLNPWSIIIFRSFYGEYEHFNTVKRSTVFRAGYQGSNFLYSYFSPADNSGIRADIGQRWYYRSEQSKIVRPYLGVNSTFEYTSLKLRDRGFNIPKDSLSSKGLSFGPEVTAGFKIVVLKKFTISPALAFRYYFNTMNLDKFTRDSRYWKYDDFFNSSFDIEGNRETLKMQHYRRGLSPVAYVHLGWIF